MTDHEHPEASRHQLLLDRVPHALTLPDLLQTHRLRLFYGDLHNHTAYSDGSGRPEEALRQMRARGLHFAAITDHGEFFDRQTTVGDADKWEATARQVAAVNGADFVAVRGFEWSSPRQGHSNVWGSGEYTGYRRTGDASMQAFYKWLSKAQPATGAQLLAGFNHPGREIICFDGCTYTPTLDERIVTLECFNRGDDYGDAYFQALDRGWHVGAIGVSDHHGYDWGNPSFPRAGLLAPTLSLASLQQALQRRHVFATRSPTLALLIAGREALMGARLQLAARDTLELGVWCHDPSINRGRVRLELWTNGATCLGSHEVRGLQHESWRVAIAPRPSGEHWFIVRVLHDGMTMAYSSPIWALWA